MARQAETESKSGGYRGKKKYGQSANMPVKSKVRKNTPDGMTVGRTEKPQSGETKKRGRRGR
ncbi:MAG: hypothetical protein ABJN26_28925 [Stappiaceae bacterium]